MKQPPVLFALAAVELARYFIVFGSASAMAGDALGAQELRFLLSPQLLTAAMLFFLGLDGARYRAFKPLFIVARAAGLFAAAVAAPQLLARAGAPQGLSPRLFSSLAAVAAWDLGSALYALFLYREPTGPADPSTSLVDESAPHAGSIETVEPS